LQVRGTLWAGGACQPAGTHGEEDYGMRLRVMPRSNAAIRAL
jgi:hypothetical protein